MVDIAVWLEGLGLARFADAFCGNKIDLDALPHITEEDPKEIGVALGARRKLLMAIADLQPATEPTHVKEADGNRPAGAEAERRRPTVMFLDLVGSSELSRRLDAEDLREVLRRYEGAVAGGRVMAPGDREWQAFERRRRDGIRLDPETLESFGELPRQLGIAAPRMTAAGIVGDA